MGCYTLHCVWEMGVCYWSVGSTLGFQLPFTVYVDEAKLELTELSLPLAPLCWAERDVPPCLTQIYILSLPLVSLQEAYYLFVLSNEINEHSLWLPELDAKVQLDGYITKNIICFIRHNIENCLSLHPLIQMLRHLEVLQCVHCDIHKLWRT